MDFADLKRAVLAAEVAVERARQGLAEAQAVLAEARAVHACNRALLIGQDPTPVDRPWRSDAREASDEGGGQHAAWHWNVHEAQRGPRQGNSLTGELALNP